MINHRIRIEQKLQHLLNSRAVTKPTADALQRRMVDGENQTNKFFSPYSFFLLSLVCDRLMDQDPEERILNIAFFIDERLTKKTCDGWRYDDMPPDDQMLIKGLDGIYETSLAMYGKIFIALKKDQQINVLKTIQSGSPPGNTWVTLSATRFFEELLAEASEIYFSHPVVQAGFGYVGMADAAGWKRIGLNETENIEMFFE